jgi:RNA polymerase sigma-70 factor (ECF subfamily)
MTQPIGTEEFVKLLAQHDREVFRYILTLLPERAAAEDVLQETAAALWNKLSQYDPQQPFLPWAFAFAHLEVLKHRKRVGRHPLLFDDALLDKLAEQRAADQTLLETRRVALEACLAAFSREDRQLLEARYTANQSVAELAEKSSIPVKRLYNSLDRLRRRLMECISRRLRAEGVL